MSKIDTSTWQPAYKRYLDCLNAVKLATRHFEANPSCHTLGMLMDWERELLQARAQALGI